MEEFIPAENREILVVGHTNPDTDSICSAIAYAALKAETEPGTFVPCRAGTVSPETAWVLRRFSLDMPRLLEDVAPQVRDMEIRRIPAVSGELTVMEAWETMRDSDISTLPVADENGELQGVISLKDIAVAQMDSLDSHALARSATPYAYIAKTLSGRILTGDERSAMCRGFILVGAGNPEAIREAMRPGDLLLVSNRESSQRAAIEGGAGCLLVCLDAEVSEDVLALARERGCVVISTPFDTYKAAYLVNQSVPIRYYMVPGAQTFHLETPLEDVVRVMGKTRFVYFPVVDEHGKYYGVISRRNLMNRSRKQLILVDHNEKSQCVPGWEEAEIREIIDHHRVGGMQTFRPIFFRNQPVGCTATILRQMYAEYGIEPSPEIAGAMCCAILSDTLLFRSPTCTAADRIAAEELAALAGEDLTSLGEAMFEAGENLDGKSGEDILTQDYKIFTADNFRMGIAQSMFFSSTARMNAEALVTPELEARQREDGLDAIYYLLTDIRRSESRVLFAGTEAADVLWDAFPDCAGNTKVQLPGVVSRKKQFVPAMMEAIHHRNS